MKYIVSACLAGVSCRHDGRHSLDEDVLRLVRDGKGVPACPEQLGGLATPRPRAELRQGDGTKVLTGDAAAVDVSGRVVTDEVLRGAIEFYRLARAIGARAAILKDRSSSCGARNVTVNGKVRSGRGVAAALLEAEGLKLLIPADLRRRDPAEGALRR